MVEYVPALKIRADSISTSADFMSFAENTLSLRELVDGFTDVALLEGVFSHSCRAIRGTSTIELFGGQGSAAVAQSDQNWETVHFGVSGWDQQSYEVEHVLPAGRLTADRRASLHAMTVVYVCRGLALLEAGDDLAEELTATERRCLDRVAQGVSYLDIGEELGCSVQAVKIHVQRARRKSIPW